MMYTLFCDNRISLSIAKINYIIFARYIYKTTFLDVTTDESLSWKKNHINSVKSKISIYVQR